MIDIEAILEANDFSQAMDAYELDEAKAVARGLIRAKVANKRRPEQEARTRLAISLAGSKSRKAPITLAPVAFMTRGDAE